MGARGVQQLRETAIELQMAPIRASVHIPVPTLWAHFQGGDVAQGLAELEKSANVMIDDLFWWTAALKAARERDEDKSIRGRDLCGPFPHNLVFVRRPARHGWRHGLVEERHGEVAKVKKSSFNPLSLLKMLKNPLSRLFGKPALSCAADDY
jgi:hypothetical protein